MIRFFIVLFTVFVPLSLVSALPRIAPMEISRDLMNILQGGSQLADMRSESGVDVGLISAKYFHDIDIFTHKYSLVFQSLVLRPTIDRSLSYQLHIQDYSLSCEIAALRIVLDRLGVIVSERDIFASIPQFPQAYSTGGIWGDPDTEFVGYYTGGQTKQTGYGVYEFPLAQYSQIYSLHTRIINQASYTGGFDSTAHIGELLSILDDPKSHVILWGDWCSDPVSDDGFFAKGGKSLLRFFPVPARNRCWRSASERILKWQTPLGKNIIGLSGEHAFILLGYVGSKNKPTHIVVWDTYTGRHVYPYDELMRKWSLLQYRSLIISQ
ncbi:hypothetical protein H7170_02635 [Candidatus Gracilibacteria bacterium]|nr:hypothetical protein [Candidatus Gracilibacteria bacterium]